ncbi:MAG: AMP-binding protein, partial [Desulfobacterales bacterium]
MSDPYAQKPWLKHYDDHVPECLDYPQKTYIEVVRETTTHIPTRAAVYYMGRGITFHEIDILSNQLAHFLKKSGLEPGDTVGVNLPNIPAYYISILAVQKAGCVLTGVSPLLQPKELEYQLNDSGAKLLVTLDALFDKVATVVGRTGVQTLAAASIADFLSPLKRGLGKLLKKIPRGKIRPISGIST